MCDFGHDRPHQAFGYLVDRPAIRALIDETRRLTAEMPDTAARVEALKPADLVPLFPREVPRS